ncbi:hypothetical protein AAMO2058_000648400 [Amorphochlora amoebiformis]
MTTSRIAIQGRTRRRYQHKFVQILEINHWVGERASRPCTQWLAIAAIVYTATNILRPLSMWPVPNC